MSMSAGIAGARRRWAKDLANGTAVNLQTQLSGAPLTRPLLLSIPSGITLGGITNAGTLSSFISVNLKIYGDAHGYGGTAGASNSGAGGAGGHALNANNQSNLTVDVETGGELRGGGGGGGGGGLGGYGMTTTNQLYGALSPPGISCLDNHNYMWIYGPSNPPECACWWAGVLVFNATTTIYTKQVGDKWYWPGLDGSPGQYHIYRGTHAGGTKGPGGAGGAGQGYNQAADPGAGGTAGINRAGNGGAGGTGGAWAAAGGGDGTDNKGGGGLYYSSGTQGRNTPSTGTNGGGGGAAGKAAYNTTGVTINNNGGTISGATS